MNIFYDHLTIREEFVQELDKYQMDVIDREEIISLMDETIHHRVLTVILSKLPKEKHEQFVNHFHKAPYDPKLLEFLKTDIADIEEAIINEAIKVKKELLSEIKKSLKK